MKKKLYLIIFTGVLFMLLAFSVSGITIKEFESDSTYKPVDYSSHKSVSAVTLYGNTDYLCMKAFSDTDKGDLFCLEVYSDSKYKKALSFYSNTFNKGTKYDNILFDLTGFESGTYYALAYVKKDHFSPYDYDLRKDPATEVKFKIVIKREGKADIKNSPLIMYGYENTEKGPTIYWYNLPKAKGYHVYRKDGDKYKKIATVKTNKGNFGSYTDKTYKGKNATKVYKIKAYSGSTVTGYSDNYVKAYIIKAPTVKLSATSSSIKISWNKVATGAKYTVFKATKKGGEWKEIETTKNRYYYDTSVKNNKPYYYTVVAVTDKTISAYDVSGVGIRYFAAPVMDKIDATETSLTVFWKAVAGAESYEIYRKTEYKADWEMYATSKETYFVDDAAEKGGIYYYNVKAVKGNSKSALREKGIRGGYFEGPVVNDITIGENGGPVVSWSADEAFDDKFREYHVYIREEGSDKWGLVGTTTLTTFTHKYPQNDLESAKTYYYTVKAVENVYGLPLDSQFDEVGKPFTYFDKIGTINVRAYEKGITLSWNEIKGAEGYNVYRKTADEDYVLLGTTTERTYTDETAEKNIPYAYKIVYVYGGTEYDDYGSEKKATLVDNDIEFSSEPIATGAYCRFKLSKYNENADYLVFMKTNKGYDFIGTFRGGDGVIEFYNDEIKEFSEYYISSVLDGEIVAGFDEAKSVKVHYFKVERPKTTPDHAAKAITVSWTPVEGAEQYSIYRNGEFLATVTQGTSYKDENLNENEPYTYSVKVLKDNCVATASSFSETIMITPKLTAKMTEKGVEITCNGVELDSTEEYRYEYFRKDSEDDEWEKLVATLATSYVDTTVKSGKTYYYTVRGYDYKVSYGAYAEESKITYLAPAEITSIKLGDGKVTVKWDKSAGADFPPAVTFLTKPS